MARPDGCRGVGPSGRTAAAFASAPAPSAGVAGRRCVCAVRAAMVAAQRVHAGAHCPTDVAEGRVIGSAAPALIRAARL
ncbi:phosphatase PAP2 family protein [Streptomyces violaceus]|uniref:phosphatase PAP2 family protein n=1 Tax=Streptomyces violaceus TaxID=1936 RepID=UPI002E242638